MRLLFLLFPFFAWSCFASMETVEPGTPFFSAPGIGAAPYAVAQQTFETEAAEPVPFRFTRHPLSWRGRLFPVTLNGKKLWMPENLTAVRGPGGYHYEFRHLSPRVCLGLLTILIAVFLISRGWKNKRQPLFFGSAVVLLQIGWTLYVTGRAVYIPAPTDELSYFQAGQGLAAWDFSGQWRYTIGFPLLESIFLRIHPCKDFYEYELFQLYLNGIVLFPAAVLMLWLALRKLLKSDKTALWSVILFQGMSALWQFRDFWHSDMARWSENIYKSFFALPDTGFSYRYYITTTWTGFNALSEPLSCLCVFGLLAFLLYLKPAGWKLFLFAVLYGFACMVRINNIMFAPVFGYLILRGTWRTEALWKTLVTGSLGFLLGFLPQLIVNTVQFGSPFTLPYVLHDAKVYRGFLPEFLPSGIRFLFSVDYAWFFLGMTGLALMKDRELRMIFGLWIFPLTFFFLGYPQLSNNGVRFLLPVLCILPAVFCGSGLWNRDRKQWLYLILFFAVLMLPSSPVSYGYDKILQWDLQKFQNGVQIAHLLNLLAPVFALVTAVFSFRKDRKMLILLTILTLIYASGCPWLLFAGCCLLFLRLFLPETICGKRELRNP